MRTGGAGERLLRWVAVLAGLVGVGLIGWSPVAAIRDADRADATGGVVDHDLLFYGAVFLFGLLAASLAVAALRRSRRTAG